MSDKQIKLTDSEIYEKIEPIQRKAAFFGKLSLWCNLGWIVALVSVIFGYWVIAIISALTVALILVVFLLIKSDYSREIKTFVFENLSYCVLSEFFELEDNCKDVEISVKAIRESRLVDRWSDYRVSDCFKAKYKGVGFVFSNVWLYYETSHTDGESTYSSYDTRFKGQWLIIDSSDNTIKECAEAGKWENVKIRFHRERGQIHIAINSGYEILGIGNIPNNPDLDEVREGIREEIEVLTNLMDRVI
jgi:hypothetical protein